MKKIKIIIFLIILIISGYRSYDFFSDVIEIQNHKNEILQENFLTTFDIVSNFFRSLEDSLNSIETIKSLQDFELQTSTYLTKLTHYDKNYNFLSGFERASWNNSKGRILEKAELEDNFDLKNLKTGWSLIRLNPEEYTTRGTYFLETENDGFYLAEFSLVPAIRKIYSICFGYNSYAFVKRLDKLHEIPSFIFKNPNLFSRIFNKELFFEAPLVSNYSFVFKGFWNEVYPYNPEELKAIYSLILLWGITFSFFWAFIFNSSWKNAKTMTWPSIIFNLFTLLSIYFLYQDLPNFYKAVSERTNSFQDSLVTHLKDQELIPTSFYIDSLSFPNDSNCYVSGFVSQIYPKDTLSKVGFIFPNESAIYESSIEEISRIEGDNYTSILYHFSICLTQNFSSNFYPFDKRDISLLIKPKDLSNQIVFFPNFQNYFPDTYLNSQSLDQRVKPNGWKFSSIDYVIIPINNLEFFGLSISPLTFKLSLILKRNFLGAFLSNILVFTLCIFISFLILFIPIDSLLNSLYATLSIFVGLLFIAVTNHSSIRSNFTSSTYAFIEFLFISYYLLILIFSIDFIYRVYKPSDDKNLLILRRILYFPTLLGSFSLILAYSIF
jgi:hypothetical protein